MTTIIEAKHVSVMYGRTVAIDDISFSVKKGDFIGLAGPNGAGKTTLMKAILGLIPVSKGRVMLFGLPQKSFRDYSKIGYLPQKHSGINPLFPATVEEVVLLGLLSSKKSPKLITKTDTDRVDGIIRTLDIGNLKGKMIAELSGGQQQKVMLARALVSDPELLVFDEPSTALDPKARQDFFSLVQKINKEKKITVILITHDTGYIGSYASKLLYIDRKLVHFGKISDMHKPNKTAPYFEKSEHHIIWHQHD